MKSVRWARSMGAVAVVVALAGLAPAWAVQVGINFDVHQDINPLGPPWPNDFHIEGLISSSNGILPVVLDHVDNPFPTFNFTVVPAGLSDPGWFRFTADWQMPLGSTGIPYCTVIHLGILLDVQDENVIIDLHGWWTLNGQPIGHVIGGLRNGGYVPQVGFLVQDAEGPQFLRIANGNVIEPPSPITPPIEMAMLGVDVLSFPPAEPPPFRELRAGGAQEDWPWVPVANGNGPIAPGNPVIAMPDSFFDVFLEVDVPPPGGFAPIVPMPIQPGGFLVARQRALFANNNFELEERWFWEIHGAQPGEACCFDDGHCEMLRPADCMQRGGQPMGPGTTCDTVVCEPRGACCLDDVAVGCVITTQVICAQMLGHWKGVGTNCDDLDGNGVADICEQVVPVEACCLPDGTCQLLPPADCLAHQGLPMGAGTLCMGDHNGNGTDDLCDAKWLQTPDLTEQGIDVAATAPYVLADDFLCTQHNLITGIAIWGSWLYDVLPGDPLNVEFTLSLHRDIPDPDDQGPAYSMPGAPLWVRTFVPGEFIAEPYAVGLVEGWMWPPADYVFPGDTICWLYYFHVPPHEAFCQEGTPDGFIVYWLDVQARPLGADAMFGWKTSTKHWNDDATWSMGPEPSPGPWNELRYPPMHPLAGQSIDLAFALYSDAVCPPRPCPGDCDCDGDRDFDDIKFFVAALGGEASWVSYHIAHLGAPPTCGYLANCDIDGNGTVDFDDIKPFVRMIGQPCP